MKHVWICVKIDLSGLRQTSLQHIGFCFLNVTRLTRGFNFAMLSLDMNTEVNIKKKKTLILVRSAISHTALLINASFFF
jgi:hypothetical protein